MEEGTGISTGGAGPKVNPAPALAIPDEVVGVESTSPSAEVERAVVEDAIPLLTGVPVREVVEIAGDGFDIDTDMPNEPARDSEPGNISEAMLSPGRGERERE